MGNSSDDDDTQTFLDIIDSAIDDIEFHKEAIDGAANTSITAYECEVRFSVIRPLHDSVSKAFREVKADLNDAQLTTYQTKVRTFKTDFFMVTGAYKERIQELNASFNQNAVRLQKTSTNNVRCPKIELPTFDGSYDKWIKFRDLYESLIHNHQSLTNVEKFQYLELSLKLPAGHANVLDNYKICADDYETAWKAVCDRYNDKRKILAIHCAAMRNVKKMSSESASEMRRVLDAYSSNINSLRQLDYDIGNVDDFGNMIIVQEVLTKLDDQTVKEWKKFIKDDCSTWKVLHDFLVAQWRSLEDVTPPKKPTQIDPKSNSRQSRALVASKQSDFKCPLCSDSHGLWQCEKFKGMTIDERQKVVREKKLCMNCFSKSHQYKSCTSKNSCKTCKQRHNTLLHFDRSSNSSGGYRQDSSLKPTAPPFEPFHMRKSDNDEAAGTSATCTGSAVTFIARQQTLLSTVVADVEDSDGQLHSMTILLDQGSDTNHITSRAAKLLNLRCEDACITVTGIGENTSVVRHTTKAVVSSRYGPYRLTLDFSVIPTITGHLPSQRVKLSDLEIPDDIILADPRFNVPKGVDMLLNSEVFCDALLGDKITLRSGPKLLHTKFGWIIGGTIKGDPQSMHRSLLSCFAYSNVGLEVIDEKLERFFEMEDFDSARPTLTPEEKYCENLYENTTFRDDDGRFVVQMPFKSNHVELGTNFNNALRMVYAQESRRKKDDVYNKLYIEYMQDLIDSGHMQEVQPDGEFAHYLPHHGVVKMSSSTTKLRPVCNASSKSETGLSLNDVMCSGPVVQQEMFDILLRAREFEFVMMADITKMYRQIWVHPAQRRYLRILWRADPHNEPIKHYELKTVTFGTTCAPYLATRTVMKLASEYQEKFPEAAQIIRDASYVDDFYFGVKSIEQGLRIRDQLRNIFASSGMTLCKFASNAPELLSNLPKNLIESSPDDDEKNIIKTLGIVCELKTDQFAYRLKPIAGGNITKATVLSEIASIYDPVGWIGAVVLRAKLFMKRLWLLNLAWNDPLPEQEQEEWQEFREDFPALSTVRIKRHCYVKNPVTIEVHGFCDASIEAYGAAIYVRSTDKDGKVEVSLVCAKSRVAPKKQKSLARLELCGALLAAKLTTRVVKVLSYPINDVIIWCDSTIVLNWITMLSSKLQTFVGNRVAAIQELSEKFQWNHISGSDNPADIISRGLRPQEIQNCAIWWKGPTFLQNHKESWPQSIIIVNESDPEVAQEMKRVTLATRKQSTLFEQIENHYSDYQDLIIHFGLMLRFIQNLKTPSDEISGPLSIEEDQKAEIAIIRIIQSTLYPCEYEILKKQRDSCQSLITDSSCHIEIHQISRQSSLIALMPFMDDKGIMRVGGRLQNCPTLTYDQQHQIILPPCQFSEMIVRKLHCDHHHPTLLTMHNILRQKFWVIKAKHIIKKVTRYCITCFRVNPTQTHQLMAPLPRARVTLTPPFTSSALDYAGFYIIRSGTTRNAPKTKVYVALFKCMCTGAIHLDLAADLSSKAFIATLDRFISRRGLCEEIYSDNATCFEGADNELREIVKKNDSEVHQYCKSNQIKWQFTTPRASHAGGIYESGIKSMKHHLKRIMGEKTFTFEQFQTVLCKVEAVLNSRPITPMSDDPNDLQALTPGHFLIGRPLVAKPEHNFLPATSTQLEKWAQVQQAQQSFWASWYHDYLHTLQTRPKNFQEKVEFSINDMVILRDSNLPPLKWVIGRIIKLYPDKMNVVRNVRVRTPTGEKDRHVKYLCLLPIEKSS